MRNPNKIRPTEAGSNRHKILKTGLALALIVIYGGLFFNSTVSVLLPFKIQLPSEISLAHAADLRLPQDGSKEFSRRELVFVDESIQNYGQLIDDLLTGRQDGRRFEVVVLDSTGDGIDQISGVLSNYRSLDAVHFVSHGTNGAVKLGSAWLRSDSLNDYVGQIAGWRNALAATADLLFYGCELASNAEGRNLVESLSVLIGADVAASTDNTGHVSLGGDWDLEYAAGVIDAGVPYGVDVRQTWMHLMPAETVRDNFSSVSYSNNDGTQNWTGDWQELGESDGASSGKVRVVSSPAALRIGSTETINGSGALREVDLSTASSATLTFYAWRSASRAATITLAVSNDGGTNWTDLQTWSFSSLTSTPSFKTFDISAYVSANTQIRFLGGGEADSAYFYADNIQIEVDDSCTSTTTVALNPTRDTYIMLKSDVHNHGTCNPLIIDRESTDLQRALFHFDLSSIPAGATITAATLELTAEKSADMSVGVYRMTADWDEGSQCGNTDQANWNERQVGTPWSTAGGDHDSTAVASNGTIVAGLNTWDVQSLVQNWVDGTHSNFGVMVGSPDGGGDRKANIYPREDGDASRRPVLRVTYAQGMRLADHAAGQEPNNLREVVTAVSAAELFAFQLQNDTPCPLTVNQIQFQIAAFSGIAQVDFANLAIYVDDNADGTINGSDTTGTMGGLGVVDGSVTTITFNSSFDIPAETTVNFILKGDVSDLTVDDTFTLVLAPGNVALASGGVGGATTTSATHTVEDGPCDVAVPVACGSTTAASIDVAGYWDAYQVTLADPTWLKIYTTGTTDTYGHLYDGSCTEIAQNDTTDGNFLLSQTLEAGTYYVQVRHALPSGTGAYDLVVECINDDHGDELEEATAIDCSTDIGGQIESHGDVDYFKAVFWGTGILTAYSSGSDDVIGELLDEAGNIIAADDDSGGGQQFEIAKTVSPGVYYIGVKAKNPGTTCAYTLHLECEYTPVITATAEYGGTISPEGAVGVGYDTNQSFTITPAAGNTIRDVWVDGVWVGPVSSYEFTNVQADHKIVAVFNADFENCVDIPDIPLDAWYRSAPANVMFVLDDSGSMDWEFMTTADDGLFENYYRYVFDDPGDHVYSRVLPDNRRMRWKSQWSGYNRLYYDPTVAYEPWPNHVEGDPALTLAPADPDTPRSHPMHAGTTFDLNGTYYQFTSDTDAIIVDDRDPEFSKTPASGGGTLLSTGIEEGSPAWEANWDGNGAPAWTRANDQAKSGSWSAKGDNSNQGNLTTDNLDASDLVAGDSITVDFWFRKKRIENDEFILYYYDGSGYDRIVDLEPGYSDDTWHHYQQTITDSQYFIPNFRVRFYHKNTQTTEMVWLDDVLIMKNKAGTVGWEKAMGSDQAHNGEYWWTGADGDYTATWTPDIPTGGDYDVYARWHADDHHSENVPYTVNYDAGGTDTVTVNQRQDGGKWVKLGTYTFAAGTGGNVTITYTRSGDTDRVCADAVKFVPAGTIDAIDIIRAHYYVWSESAGKPYLVVLDQAIDYYEVNDSDADGEIEDGEIAPAVSPPADVQTSRSFAQERQNFANWYQYYRRRELSATTAVAKVIAGLKGVQVGFYSINGNLVQPVVPVKTSGIDKSKRLLQALYALRIRSQGTPLRRGLREVGKYFADSSTMIGSSPYATEVNGGSCQQAFTIVMTDGFWNGGNPYIGNTDADGAGDFDGGGYADIYSDTLADVAMHYYETDLHSGLDDHVPANAMDAAPHQHMVTYAVSFGVMGSLNPADYDTANGTYPVWPDPRYVKKHKIDDLWHAAVNGRGEFLNAANPTELVNSLLAISRSIDARIASSSSVSVNGDPLYEVLDDETRMYQALYRSDGWIGDVNAYRIDGATGEVAASPDWSAAAQLETLNWNTDRVIATYDGTQGIPFRYDRDVLSADQQTALGSDLVADSTQEQDAVKILNYLRGERSNEVQNGGTLRDRFQVLGDIVHSSPVYSNGMLYAGGNDGMLHAFDAATGLEKFAYVPNLVFGNLSFLIDPDYSHRYYVDLSPTIANISLSGQPRTYLVGGLGKGGKGYYALDVTNAKTDITDEATLAGRVLWEFPDPRSEGRGNLAYTGQIMEIPVGSVVSTPGGLASGTVADIPVAYPAEGTGVLELINVTGVFQDGDDLLVGAGTKVAVVDGRLYDAYMGYSYSRPVIAQSNDPTVEWLVIFGNGYDSQRSHAVLYILNLATGELVRRIDTGVGNCNGLSSPIAIDVNNDDKADYVYAGDLQGNLWKFDLQDADAANWTVAYQDPANNPAPVFQAKNLSGHHQPITSKPDVMYHCKLPGYMVIFGTGRYLTELDLESTESNSIYGIWDYGDDADNSEYLGSFERAAVPQLSNLHLDGVASWTRVKLLEQTVESGSWTTTDGRHLRVITDNDPVWGTVADSDTDQQPDPGSLAAGEMVDAGWYFDLPNAGEMVVSDVIIRDGKVLVISFTPGRNPCGSGGTSIFHALHACTGARPNSEVFVDINAVVHNPVSGGETTITKSSSDWIEITGIEFTGRLQPPVILRSGGIEYNYLSSSTGDVFKQSAAAARMGLFYWLQVE